MIFHVKFCVQLEAHVLICAEVIVNITKLGIDSQASIAQLDSAITQRTNEGLPCEFSSSQNIFSQKYFFEIFH